MSKYLDPVIWFFKKTKLTKVTSKYVQWTLAHLTVNQIVIDADTSIEIWL